MYRHTIKLSLIALLSTLLTVHAVAQMNYWTIGSNKINMTTATPTQTTLPGGSSVDYESNGAYDQSGNLLFYVSASALIGPTGLFLGALPSNTCPEALNSNPYVIIVPVPGTCKQFYVFYSRGASGGLSHVYYVKVDCSTATPVVTYETHVIPSPCTGYQTGFDTGLYSTDFYATFVVSKPIGTGASAKRFIYALAFDGIYKADITASGVSTPTLVVSSATLGLSLSQMLEIVEADLSWGGDYLAWTTNTGDITETSVHYIKLDPTTGLYATVHDDYHGVLPGANGIEFSNETSSFTKLYITGGTTGLNQFTKSTTLGAGGTVTSVTTTGFDLTHSFLQYAKNGKIYGISPTYTSGTLTGTILVGFTTPATGSPVISSYNPGLINTYRFTGGSVNVFTLPRQVNGEDYTYFFGVANSVASFKINGINASTGTSCSGSPGPIASYNCAAVPITLANLSTGAVSYKIDLVSVVTCSGAGSLVYTSGDLATFPTNLKALPGTNGTWLTSHTGLFQVGLTTKNACGTTSIAIGYINVAGPPAAPVTGFTINGINAASTVCATPLITFGCPAYLITLANTTTGASTYNIDLYSYSVCGTNTLVNSTGYVSTFPTNLKALPGANGTWLTSHTGNFKVVLTAKTICGTTGTAIGYINVAGTPTGASIGLKTTASIRPSQTITITGCTIITTMLSQKYSL